MTLWALAVIALLGLASATFGQEATRYAKVQFVPFPPHTGNAMFSAMACGIDGTIYIGTSYYHGGGAHLLAYRPETGQMEDLGNMQDVCNEHDPELIYQSKVHTQICIADDGKVYFGTHSVEREEAKNLETFPKGYLGGHWAVYDPGTREFQDLGIPLPKQVERPTEISQYGESLITMGIDPKRKVCYAITHPGAYFLVYDIRTGKTVNKGKIGKFPARSLQVAADDRVYTYGDRGQVLRYDPDTGELEWLPLYIPPPPGGDAEENYSFAMASNEDHTRIYGHGHKSGHLFELVCEPGAEPFVNDLGQAIGEEREGTFDWVHAMTMGKDGKVYYATKLEGKLHLARFDPSARRREDLGVISIAGTEAKEAPELGQDAWASATGADGTIYLGGKAGSTDYMAEENTGIMIYKP